MFKGIKITAYSVHKEGVESIVKYCAEAGINPMVAVFGTSVLEDQSGTCFSLNEVMYGKIKPPLAQSQSAAEASELPDSERTIYGEVDVLADMEKFQKQGLKFFAMVSPYWFPFEKDYPDIACKNLKDEETKRKGFEGNLRPCPNNEAYRDYMRILFKDVASRGVDGVLSSFEAYGPGGWTLNFKEIDKFDPLSGWYCFCNACRKKAMQEGIDVEAVIQDIKKFGAMVQRIPSPLIYHPYLNIQLLARFPNAVKWMRWRASQFLELLQELNGIVKGVDKKIIFGSNIAGPPGAYDLFYDELAEAVDFLLPMLYPQWEYSPQAVQRKDDRLRYDAEVGLIFRSFGSDQSAEDVIAHGVSPDIVRGEVQLAKLLVNGKCEIWAGIGLGRKRGSILPLPDRVTKLVDRAVEGGTEGLVGCWYDVPKEDRDAFARHIKRL